DHAHAKVHRIADRLSTVVSVGEWDRSIAYAEHDLAGLAHLFQGSRLLCGRRDCDGKNRHPKERSKSKSHDSLLVEYRAARRRAGKQRRILMRFSKPPSIARPRSPRSA